MGIWALPTTKTMDRLEVLLADPLEAAKANIALYHVIGCDDLADAVDEANAVDAGADVRSLVVARLNQLYRCTGVDACNTTPAITARIHSILDGYSPEPDDIFFRIGRFSGSSGDDAKSLAAAELLRVLDLMPDDRARIDIARDRLGLDFVGRYDGRTFLVEAISACVTEIPAELAANHDSVFDAGISVPAP
jgi:hypothetical protein